MHEPMACAYCEVPLATGPGAPHYVQLTEHYPPDPHDPEDPTEIETLFCDWQCLLHWMINELLLLPD